MAPKTQRGATIKTFSLDEANRTLPLVRRIAEDISTQYREMAERHRLYQTLNDPSSGVLDRQHAEELVDLERRLEEDRDRIVALAEELHDLGVQLKGEADGLLDFPAIRDGKLVLLCWKLGEPEVQHWHDLESGFRGRQRIEAGEFATGGKVEVEFL